MPARQRGSVGNWRRHRVQRLAFGVFLVALLGLLPHTGRVRGGVIVGLFVVVLGWHGAGLWQRFRPLDATTARARLAVGALDRDDRRRCLIALRDDPSQEAPARTMAAAAAIALDDREAFLRLRDAAGRERALLTGEGPPWPPTADEARALTHDAALGEHWLHHLLLGLWLRAAADPGAVAELDSAIEGAKLSDAKLGGELARAARAALPPPKH